MGDQHPVNISRNLYIITALPLHKQQGASFARIMAYAGALTRDPGVSVWLLSTKYPAQISDRHEEIGKRIWICGTEGQHAGDRSFAKRTSGKVFGKADFRKFLGSVRAFIAAADGQKSVLVYPSINNFSDEQELLNTIKSMDIPVFSERNELNIEKMLNYPFPKNPLKKALFGIYYPFKYYDHFRQDRLVARYDGNIAISTALEERIGKLNPNLLRIPILADVQKISRVKGVKREDSQIQLGFTGYLTMKKDGIGELIEAIALLDSKYGIANVRLNLYGTGYRDTLRKIQALIAKRNLRERVILHGAVPSGEIPAILGQQDILLLTRPDNLQTRYGFSTKLAEYMASGVPVLITSVSDNARYVKDGENGFIACSYRAADTAERLHEIISRKEYLDESIGNNGRETALAHFDGQKYSGQLLQFLFPEKN